MKDLRVYFSFISEYGLWKEERLTGELPRTSIQMRFGEGAIEAEFVTLKVNTYSVSLDRFVLTKTYRE